MNRRSMLKILSLFPLMIKYPQAFAQNIINPALGQTILYGPPAMPTMLLGVVEKYGALKEKYDIKPEVWRTVDILRAGIANKSINLSIVPSYVAANFSNRGIPVKLINIMTFGLVQIVGRGGNLNSLTELEGKKLVIPFKNDMPDLIFQALCSKLNIDLKSINITYTSTPPEAMSLFLKEKVDYALLPEPLASMATVKGGNKVTRVLDINKLWAQTMGVSGGIPQAGLMVTESFYKSYPEFVNTLQSDLEKAVTWTNTEENKREAISIASSLLKVPRPAIKRALPYSNLSAKRTDTISKDIMIFFEELYRLNPKILGGQMPSEKLFTI